MTEHTDPCECLYDNPISLNREKWVNGKLINSVSISTIVHHSWYRQLDNVPLALNWFKQWEDHQVQGCPFGLPTVDNTASIEFKTEEDLDKLSDFGYMLCNDYFNRLDIPIQAFLCSYKVDVNVFTDVIIRGIDIPIHLDRALSLFFNEPEGMFSDYQKAERSFAERLYIKSNANKIVNLINEYKEGKAKTYTSSELRKELGLDSQSNPSSDT